LLKEFYEKNPMMEKDGRYGKEKIARKKSKRRKKK
jgi:hypothetical protein